MEFKEMLKYAKAYDKNGQIDGHIPYQSSLGNPYYNMHPAVHSMSELMF